MKRNVLLLAVLVLFAGCVPKDLDMGFSQLMEKKGEVYYVRQETSVFKTRAGKAVVGSARVGDEVSVTETADGMAETAAGWIRLDDLEKVRSMFRLTVEAPEGAGVKVLNIKPKYRDGMWLRAGTYHIAVHPRGKGVVAGWINLSRDTTLSMRDIEEQGVVHLTVKASADSTVKILNIKERYRDGIPLRHGSYHISVYCNGKQYHDQWVKLTRDTEIVVAAPEKAKPTETAKPTEAAGSEVAAKPAEAPKPAEAVGLEVAAKPAQAAKPAKPAKAAEAKPKAEAKPAPSAAGTATDAGMALD